MAAPVRDRGRHADYTPAYDLLPKSDVELLIDAALQVLRSVCSEPLAAM
jgi:hypothetical protein